MTRIIHIVAMDKNGTIGVNDKLPFHIPEDLSNFKAATMDALIVMGFKTYQSIADNYSKTLDNNTKDPNSFLPGRKVTVVCSTKEKGLKNQKKNCCQYDTKIVKTGDNTFTSSKIPLELTLLFNKITRCAFCIGEIKLFI